MSDHAGMMQLHVPGTCGMETERSCDDSDTSMEASVICPCMKIEVESLTRDCMLLCSPNDNRLEWLPTSLSCAGVLNFAEP